MSTRNGNTHEHTTFDEQMMFALSIVMRTICMVAAAYIYFGVHYLPEACAAGTLVQGKEAIAYTAIGVVCVATVYFSTYGTNWTPTTQKYEYVDASIWVLLGAVVLLGWFRNAGAQSIIMLYATWMFGTLIVFGIIFDWFARIAKRRSLERQAPAPAADTPTQ